MPVTEGIREERGKDREKKAEDPPRSANVGKERYVNGGHDKYQEQEKTIRTLQWHDNTAMQVHRRGKGGL